MLSLPQKLDISLHLLFNSVILANNDVPYTQQAVLHGWLHGRYLTRSLGAKHAQLDGTRTNTYKYGCTNIGRVILVPATPIPGTSGPSICTQQQALKFTVM